MSINPLTTTGVVKDIVDKATNVRGGGLPGAIIRGTGRSIAKSLMDRGGGRPRATPRFSAASAAETDWRIKLLCRDPRFTDGPVLEPLQEHGGVLFPYTPQVAITHTAAYNSTIIPHSNYPVHNYQSSNVDNIIITGDFTAQNETEARFCLATIHFMRSVTKMFYGNEADAGTPPPLLFLNGMGDYMFSNIPVLVSSSYLDLPSDVDYISVPTTSNINYGNTQFRADLGQISRIPTKFSMNVTLMPAYSRESLSEEFSLNSFLNGDNISSKGGGGFL